MKQDLLFIEADGRLFRGYGRLWPVLRWNSESKSWVQHREANPQPEPWGELITPREAERLFPCSTTVSVPKRVASSVHLSGADLVRYRPELFGGYDGPLFRNSPEEEAEREAAFASLMRPA